MAVPAAERQPPLLAEPVTASVPEPSSADSPDGTDVSGVSPAVVPASAPASVPVPVPVPDTEVQVHRMQTEAHMRERAVPEPGHKD